MRTRRPHLYATTAGGAPTSPGSPGAFSSGMCRSAAAYLAARASIRRRTLATVAAYASSCRAQQVHHVMQLSTNSLCSYDLKLATAIH